MAPAFQLRFMAFTIDFIDRRGPSNKMRRQLKAKEGSKRHFTRPSLLTR